MSSQDLLLPILIAYASLFVTQQVNLNKAIIAVFNGFLIYLTLVGGTSNFSLITAKTADTEFQNKKPFLAAFVRHLNPDKNLLIKSVFLQNSIQAMMAGNRNLMSYSEELQKKNDIYIEGINSLKEALRSSQSLLIQKDKISETIASTEQRIKVIIE